MYEVTKPPHIHCLIPALSPGSKLQNLNAKTQEIHGTGRAFPLTEEQVRARPLP